MDAKVMVRAILEEYKNNKKEPVPGLEPGTSCLLGKCSTTKLYRLDCQYASHFHLILYLISQIFIEKVTMFPKHFYYQ